MIAAPAMEIATKPPAMPPAMAGVFELLSLDGGGVGNPVEDAPEKEDVGATDTLDGPRIKDDVGVIVKLEALKFKEDVGVTVTLEALKIKEDVAHVGVIVTPEAPIIEPGLSSGESIKRRGVRSCYRSREKRKDRDDAHHQRHAIRWSSTSLSIL
jgi:hypothetical protein